MELGGKAPSIVCEDADLGVAALQCTLGAFLYSGQICMCKSNRMILHDPSDQLTLHTQQPNESLSTPR